MVFTFICQAQGNPSQLHIYEWIVFPRVKHLILADPWGFPEKPADIAQKYNLPLWVRAIVFIIQPFNPLWPVRVAGPFGKQSTNQQLRNDVRNCIWQGN